MWFFIFKPLRTGKKKISNLFTLYCCGDNAIYYHLRHYLYYWLRKRTCQFWFGRRCRGIYHFENKFCLAWHWRFKGCWRTEKSLLRDYIKNGRIAVLDSGDVVYLVKEDESHNYLYIQTFDDSIWIKKQNVTKREYY